MRTVRWIPALILVLCLLLAGCTEKPADPTVESYTLPAPAVGTTDEAAPAESQAQGQTQPPAATEAAADPAPVDTASEAPAPENPPETKAEPSDPDPSDTPPNVLPTEDEVIVTVDGQVELGG